MPAADRVARFTRGKTIADYQAVEMLRSGVERRLAIVGKAPSQLRRIDPALGGSIAEFARVVGFRNVLIHACASVDSRIVRGIVEGYLEPLRRSLEALLAEP